MTPTTLRIGLMVLGLTAFRARAAMTGESAETDSSNPESQQIDFVKQIQPILRGRCHECHGPDSQEAGLRLDFRKAAFEGGDNGKVIVPGKSGESLLYRTVLGEDEDSKMPPPDENKPLTRDEVALIRSWIDQGANWPDGVDGDAAKRQPGADHWAFQPIERPAPPELNDAWVKNEIDAFVLRRLKNEGATPSTEAQRHVLIRRLFLDLTGLPPTPEEMARWTEDRTENANWYEELVNHLLDSPHFGERWGRHWLDLARYADSDGYEKDLPRPFAWRWRDWVINAINRDIPFDQFTIEQLAGDLLPDATLEQKIATGFHRNTLTNREGGVDQEEYRIKAVKDRVYTTGTVWLGLTAQCGECHSHKFDPFSQREYYELAAFFNDTDEADIAAPLPGEAEAFRKAKTAFDAKHKELQQSLAGANKSLHSRQTAWEQTLAIATSSARKGVPDHVVAALDTPGKARTDAQRKELTKFYRTIDPELVRLNKAIVDLKKKQPKPPASKAPAFTGRPQPRDNYVHQRGDFRRPGETVQPGTLDALHAFEPRGEYPDRLDLAHWLVDPANPLTPRVAANRIWQHLFGRGIVETTWDFGTQGAPATHPDLIDWLAAEYIDQGWSRKAMIRLIVSSSTYRQSSAARPELDDRDPKNDLIARQNRFRLGAEIVRDLYLTASGLLHRKIGGPGVYPALPADVAALGYAGSVKWKESPAPDRYRRGMYIFFRRSVPYPMLTTFDAPESTVVSTRRDRSNTPLQSLTLLNDPVFVECSQALASRVIKEASAETDARIKYAFQLCLAREPDAFELSRLTQLHEQLLEFYSGDPETAAKMSGQTGTESDQQSAVVEAAVWTVVCRTLMNLDEFVTRE